MLIIHGNWKIRSGLCETAVDMDLEWKAVL